MKSENKNQNSEIRNQKSEIAVSLAYVTNSQWANQRRGGTQMMTQRIPDVNVPSSSLDTRDTLKYIVVSDI